MQLDYGSQARQHQQSRKRQGSTKQLHPLEFIKHEHVLLIEPPAQNDAAVHRGVVAKGW
jgi:hypothetical protein